MAIRSANVRRILTSVRARFAPRSEKTRVTEVGDGATDHEP
jgi:hypothetical protein